MSKNRAFTLIELLVVVGVIVVLIAILIPALSKAKDKAVQLQCTTNTRGQVQACIIYSQDFEGNFPTHKTGGGSYDLRDGGAPKMIGVMFGKYMPLTTVGKIVHCPSLDNTAGGGAGHCMDVVHGSGVGASFWTDPAHAGKRVIGGYHYRARTYAALSKTLKTNKMPNNLVVFVDIVDVRFRGDDNAKQFYGHDQGYNRSFADASAAFFPDPIIDIGGTKRGIINNFLATNGNNFDGGDHKREEPVYEFLSKSAADGGTITRLP